MNHPYCRRECGRLALPGVGPAAGRIGRLDFPPPSTCIERAVPGGWERFPLRISSAGHRADSCDARCGGEYMAGNFSVESTAGR